MEREGIITANIALVDPAKAGQEITVLIEVTMINDSSQVVDRAKRVFRDAPDVQQCYCVAGVAGFVLILTVATMAEYEERSRRLLADNEEVKSYRTIVVLDRVKISLAIDV